MDRKTYICLMESGDIRVVHRKPQFTNHMLGWSELNCTKKNEDALLKAAGIIFTQRFVRGGR